MSMRALLLGLGFLLAPHSHPLQEPDPTGLLGAARSLRCQFPSGGAIFLTDTNPRYRPAQGVQGVFDAIDRRNRRARVIGGTGAGDVQVIVAPEALTFIELSPTGYPQVTVVFAKFRPRTRELLASDSRNTIASTGQVLVEQYYGSCRVLE